MDQQGWLESAEAWPMLEFLRGRVSERRLRLFACACLRRVWDVLTEEDSRKAVEIVERYADGEIRKEELAAARDAANNASSDVMGCTAVNAAFGAASATEEDVERALQAVEDAARADVSPDARRAQAELLREIVGDPFIPAPTDLAWLRRAEGQVQRVAQSAYRSTSAEESKTLADVLEAAGCNYPELLSHLREARQHARGCWAASWVLGKA
jgi:hypothetical protein